MTADKNLSHLASTHFSLSKAESRLLEQVETGEVANYLAEEAAQNVPLRADTWDDSRQLRAALLVWLCTNTEASQFITHRGIQILGAKIVGSLDLQFATLPFPLICQQCAFTEAIRLERATVKFLDLSGSYLAGSAITLPGLDQVILVALEARGLQVESDVFLRQGFHATGMVVLWVAAIDGDLNCEQARFENAGSDALFAENIEVKGSVWLRNGFHVTGQVSLLGATIGGSLGCDQGNFEGTCGESMLASNIQVDGDVLLRRGFRAVGNVWLNGAKIGGDLNCYRGQFENAGGDAIVAQSIEVKGAVFLCQGFYAKGRVSLAGATIGGILDCGQGRFENTDGDALFAESVEVKRALLLRNDFHARGRVSLCGASIGGTIECNQGRFENPGGDALLAANIEVKGAVLLRNGFHATGQVSLLGASIGGNLDCHEGRFENIDDIALNGHSIDVKGAVYLFDGFQAEGGVTLQDAQIEDGLYLDSAMLAADSPTTWVDLRFANALTLADSEITEPSRWPQPGKLRLDGFTYEKLSPNSPIDSQYRLRWLQPQRGDGRFSPQPYTQLARVLQASGHQEEATEILIGKQEAARRYGQLNHAQWSWNWFLGKTIAHGYKSTRALWVSFAIILFGFLPFHVGYKAGLIEPSDLEAYSIANPDPEAAEAAESSPATPPPAENA